jgi:hypothetical protein
MPVTKITLSTAMRARDVARPREEHLAEAAAREERAANPVETAPRSRPAPPAPAPGDGLSLPPLPVPAPPRRRRRRGR